MNTKRNQRIVNGFLADGFEFKGIHYRPLSTRSLLLLEKVKSPFYLGTGDTLRGLIDWLFIASHESREVLKAINEGTYEETILDYAETFLPEDITALGALINESNEDAAAAIVEVREKDQPGKK